MPFSRPPLLPQGPPGRDAAFRNAGLLQMTMSKRPGGPDGNWEPKRSRMDMGRHQDMGFNRRGGRGRDSSTEYDPSRPTEDASQEFFCRICKISCWDEESMERHMTGKKHQAVVDNMRRGGVGPGMGGAGGTREYCSTCGRWIEGSFESHKGSREHLEKARRRTSAKNSGGQGGSSTAPTSTAPAVEDKEKPASEEESKSEPLSEKTSPSKEDNVKVKKTESKEEPKSDSKEESKESKDANGRETCLAEDEPEGCPAEEEIVIPEYAEKTTYGREYVVPCSGFFCRLCSKFYSSDTTAYDVHCRSRSHYDKYVVALEEQRSKKNGEDSAPNADAKSPFLGRGRGLRRGNAKA